MIQIVVHALDLGLDRLDLVVGPLRIEPRDADELQLREALHVVERHFPAQQLLEGRQPLVHRLVGRLAGLAPLDELVELVLDEDAFERSGVPRLVEFMQPDFELLPQQRPRMIGRTAQDLAHAHEVGLLVPDDAGVGRNRHLAVGEGVERVDRLVRRLVGRHLHDDLHVLGRVVVHAADLDLALLVGLDDRLLDRLGGRRIGNFGNGQRPFVDLRYLGAHLHHPAPQAVVVARHVDHAARRKVGIELERLAAQMRDGCMDQLVEVVRQDLRRQSHGDAVGTLRQQQREFDGKRHRLLLAAIVGEHPLGGLLVEDHVEREFRQPRLDVTAGGRLVAREDVAPVALAVDQQVLLPQLHQRILDRGVAVGVVLHGLPHDVGHLVVAAVVDHLHGVENAPLHGFQAVAHVGHGAFQDHVGGVVRNQFLYMPRQLAHAPVSEVRRA